MFHIVPDALVVEIGRICTSSAWIRNELTRQAGMLSKKQTPLRWASSAPNFNKLLREWQRGWHGVVDPAKYRAVIYPLSRDLAKAWIQRTDAVEGCWRQVDHQIYEVTLREKPETDLHRQTYTLFEIQSIVRALDAVRAKLGEVGGALI